MSRTHRTTRCRRLRVELLDQRCLLAFTPIGPLCAALPVPGELPRLEDNLQCGAVEVEVRLPAEEITPVNEIKIPETIAGPGRGLNPGDFEQMPGGELGEKLPLPDGVDPAKLPGSGCPNGQEPNRNDVDEWWEWYRAERSSNISDRLGSWDMYPGTQEKVHEATGRGFLTSNPFGPTIFVRDESWDADSKGSGGKDDGSKGSSQEMDTKDTDDEDAAVKEKPVDDQSGAQNSIEKDPNPEGDDPDECRDKLFDQALAMYGPSAGQSTPDANNLPRTGQQAPGQDDPWARHRAEIGGVGGVIDPEDGGPDEAGYPAAAAIDAVDAAIVSGYDRYPEPDDPDGPTDPRASEGNLPCAAVVGSYAASESASPPVDGGDGGGTGPIGPEF